MIGLVVKGDISFFLSIFFLNLDCIKIHTKKACYFDDCGTIAKTEELRMNTIPKRPVINEEMVKQAAKKVVGRMTRLDDAAKSRLESLIAEVYEDGMNGFETCKELEAKDLNLVVDSNFVSDIDEMSFHCDEVLEGYEFAWVKKYNIQPKLEVGTVVNGDTITGIHERLPASYLVKLKGHDDEKNGKSRKIVEFEDLELQYKLENKND